MFRKMRRFKQQASEAECIEILKSTKRGVLSLIGDDGYPYGVPIDHWYCDNVQCLELIPEHMTGKLVNESQEDEDIGWFEFFDLY